MCAPVWCGSGAALCSLRAYWGALPHAHAPQVEWFSALEGAVAKIVKIVAGVDEEEERGPAHTSGGGGGGGGGGKSWAEQLERTYASVGASSLGALGGSRCRCTASSLCPDADDTDNFPVFVPAGSSSGARRGSNSGGGSGSGGGGLYDRPAASSRHQMVSIVNYDLPSGGGSGPGSGAGAGRHGVTSSSGAGRAGGYGGDAGGRSDYGYVTVDYGSIAGARWVCQRWWGRKQGCPTGHKLLGHAAVMSCSLWPLDPSCSKAHFFLHAGANPVSDTAPAAGYSGAPAAGYGGGASSAYPGPGDAYGGYGQAQAPQAVQQQAAAQQGYGGYPPAAQQQAPDYGQQQQQAGYAGGNLMDAVTAPQVNSAGVCGCWGMHGCVVASGRRSAGLTVSACCVPAGCPAGAVWQPLAGALHRCVGWAVSWRWGCLSRQWNPMP